MNELEVETIDQDIVDAFIQLYNDSIGRAFMKNYLEMKKRRDLYITRPTGRKAKKVVQTIPEEDIEKIRTELYKRDERFGLIFDLSVNCALRRQEVMAIRVQDIKIEKNDKMFIRIVRGKGNKERWVYVPKEIAVLVLTFCIRDNLRNDSFLFRSKLEPEKNLGKKEWNKRFAIASYDATGKKYHPHQLRHTRATEWYKDGIDIFSIQKRLGHSDISTTMLYINPENIQELEKWSNED